MLAIQASIIVLPLVLLYYCEQFLVPKVTIFKYFVTGKCTTELGKNHQLLQKFGGRIKKTLQFLQIINYYLWFLKMATFGIENGQSVLVFLTNRFTR